MSAGAPRSMKMGATRSRWHLPGPATRPNHQDCDPPRLRPTLRGRLTRKLKSAETDASRSNHFNRLATFGFDERVLRRIAAAYFALITFLDENIAEVIRVAEELDLLATTRIIYTSDHGEPFGAQGLLGKSSLYEGSVGVPLILSGRRA